MPSAHRISAHIQVLARQVDQQARGVDILEDLEAAIDTLRSCRRRRT